MWFCFFFLKGNSLDCLSALELEGLTRPMLELPHLHGIQWHSYCIMNGFFRNFSEAGTPGPANPWLESSDTASADDALTQHHAGNWETACEGFGTDPLYKLHPSYAIRVASCNKTCKWNYRQNPILGRQYVCSQRVSLCSQAEEKRKKKLITRYFISISLLKGAEMP